MESRYQELLERQEVVTQAIRKIGVNFSKDSAHRKTSNYLKVRLDSLQALWDEFDINNTVLQGARDKTGDYFSTRAYEKTQADFMAIKQKLETCKPYTARASGANSDAETERESGGLSKTDELITLQGTNIRAFSRFIRNTNIDSITEKWEIEDKLRSLQARWKAIDDVHWQIDNLLIGSDVDLDVEYSKYEAIYERTKGALSCKLNSAIQQYEGAPKIEIPIFSGNYSQWPTFLDLYSEAIHKNPSIPKARKMQHLKGKLRGEAERLVQHLSVSADNYDSCWEILNHRYNNIQLLFTKQMQTFMSQPTIQNQNAHELKRLHDTSLETIHAIHNLGVDATTWDPMLVHILTGKLDAQTYSDYMEARESPRELPSFQEFIQFIENKFTALEPVTKKKQALVHNKQPNNNNKESPSAPPKNTFNKYNRHSSIFHANTSRSCPICKENHILIYCKSFQEMSSDMKIRSIEQLKICKNCLFSHNGNKCNSNKRCKVCNNAHHTTLHDVIRDSTSSGQQPHNSTNNTNQGKANHVSGNFNEVLLATILLKVTAADGTYLTLRCLLDQGSQINIITESAAQRLGLQRHNQNSTVSGIGVTTNHSNGTVHLQCESLYGDYKFSTQALVMVKMLNNLPNYSFEKQDWPHVQNINLADPDYNVSRAVDILLDAGVYAEIIMSGILRGSIYEPTALQTKLGWVLVGNTKTFNCHVLVNNEDISRFWEIEEITENNNSMSSDDEYCENIYTNTTRRLTDGRFEVKIPMKQNFKQHLGSSKPQAVAQFRQLEKRLTKNNELASSYKNFIEEYIALGHMKQCITSSTVPSCYLPHHGVLRPESTTTKLRVVFNASAKTSSGHSLNELMECGPNLQQDLQTMILRWRTFQYVYTADVEKFYRQIRIQDEDQHLQKIIWRETPSEPIKEYQLTTVTYGTKSAPYLSMRTIKQLIKEDGPRYPLASEILNNQLYVDDLLGGSNDFVLAQEAQHQLICMLKGGGFNLRKWASNNIALLQNLPENLISQKMYDFKDAETNKTLGITWNPHTDHFTYKQTSLYNKRDVITKRTLLSDVSKLYDPLGWLAPVTVMAKLIFQQAWLTTTSWDDPLPENIQKEWENFSQGLINIHNIEITRWIGNTQKPMELHGFCDSSERAYGCVIYSKSTNKTGSPTIKLVAAKTKLAPLKKSISLPRLELCGATLLSRLMKKVIDTTNSQTVTVHGWTDSMVVLGWLQGDVSRWKTFIANRVTQIKESMLTSCWRHVKSEENPADCASRGLNPSKILEHELWWNGPSWLKTNDLPIESSYTTTEEERKKKQACVTQTKGLIVLELLDMHSSMLHVTRVLSWVIRFINNARDVNQAKRNSHLTTADIESAHNIIIKTVQQVNFADDLLQLNKHNKVRSTSKLLNLNPYLDKYGIMRVGGRQQRATLDQQQKHPCIVPNRHKLTELLIDQSHKTTLHGGARLTLAHLRNRYWILGGMKTVKSQLRKCVTCHRFQTQRSSQLMADLPRPRVTPSRPFTHTGVDFTGHVDIKANKGRGIKTMKAYIAIFICLCTKAIHLELVSDLSTATFLAALKRLCGRRGTPKHIYSDNGTNFVGAARTLNKERQQALQLLVNDDLINNITGWGVEWHFNSPSWPTAGGLWEAAVKSMKHHLKRVLGEQKLTFEEFTTLLVQIEACLNSRPLVALTDDTEDITCLTPGHFLVGGPVLAPPLAPEVDYISLPMRWRLTEKMYRDFWKRWSNEYLQTLQVRGKWKTPTRNLEVGDIVVVKEDQIPPAKWLLGRVTETHPGSDGLVRVVTLKTKTNSMKRPITKLSRLPIEQNEHETTVNSEEQSNTTPSPPKPERRSKPTMSKTSAFTTYMSTLLVLFIACVTPTAQSNINVTTLEPTRLIYLDKISDLQIIQEEWKMVVYYNMTTYWKSVATIEQYVDHLQGLCKRRLTYLSIASQFAHELNELRHYNKILESEHGLRTKRGLINGIGYLANSLFGVLDDRFAKKYNEDIKLLQEDQNHLLSLYKQHTSIIEGEYNLLKRNEQVMNQQFIVINKHLREAEQQIKADQDAAMYVTATALEANMILSNLRRVQDSLLDLVTDVRNGKVDTHLLKPDAFENQLNIISGHLPQGLSLPCTSSHKCTREMYQLSRVHVKLIEGFLLFEVKIPLVTDEHYELTKVIPINNIRGGTMKRIIPTAEYLAINLRKDALIPLKQHDLSSCVHIHENQLLCNFNVPTYEIKTNSICEAAVINNRASTMAASSCRTEISSCRDEWTNLHRRNVWLFSCCEECSVRIFCPYGVTSLQLRHTGVITLANGCLLRGEHYLIHAHYNIQSELNIQDEALSAPLPSINEIVNTNNNITLYDMPNVSQDEELNILKRKIALVKEQQETMTHRSTESDTHTYVMYGFITFCGIAFVIWRGLKLKSSYCNRNQGEPGQMRSHTSSEHIEMKEVVTQRAEPKQTHSVTRTTSLPTTRPYKKKMDSSTSPMPIRAP